jgi:hypothetical protein
MPSYPGGGVTLEMQCKNKPTVKTYQRIYHLVVYTYILAIPAGCTVSGLTIDRLSVLSFRDTGVSILMDEDVVVRHNK